MQDLAELHRSSRPAMFPSDLGKPKASSPKNQVRPCQKGGINLARVQQHQDAVSVSIHRLLFILFRGSGGPVTDAFLCLQPSFQQNDIRVKFEFKGEKR